MNELEKLLSAFLTKDPKHPVTLHIDVQESEDEEFVVECENGEGQLNICEPDSTVTISRSRYDELIRTEMEREILFHAYQNMNSFNMDSVMDAIFNPKFKYREATSSENKAGTENA